MTDSLIQSSKLVISRSGLIFQAFLFACFSQILNLITLYLIFLAFHFSVNLGTLAASYAMAILFRIVSITPQGIGIVEGVMSLTLISLAVPGSVAVVVSLSFRGLSFWLPFMIGGLLSHRIRR